ncbi:MAG: response regulator transcription factor [Planctomycetota bacterium]|nr:response regulator transcription factor [Planctomycetota bacterium]
MSRKRIIIVEDERDMADLVAARLRKEGYQVDAAYDGAAGLDAVRAHPPDLVLLDIMMPVLSGTDVLAELRRDPRTAGVPVVMMTAKGREADVVAGLKLGADDYIAKPFSLAVLFARVEAVLRRAGAPTGPEQGVLVVGPIRIDAARHAVEVHGQVVALTLTEFRLLAALAAARGRVLTRDQLIDQVMGPQIVITDRTIDVHMTSLRRKLAGARTLLRTVRGVGYRLAAEGEADDESN